MMREACLVAINNPNILKEALKLTQIPDARGIPVERSAQNTAKKTQSSTQKR